MLKKDNNRGRKIMVIIIGVILVGIVLYIIASLKHMNHFTIGKMIYIEFEVGDADYLEMLLESENDNKLNLFAKEEVQELIQYMRDNNIKIVPGKYKIPQTSNFEEMINILRFESINWPI